MLKLFLSFGKSKLKPQWSITTHLLECQKAMKKTKQKTNKQMKKNIDNTKCLWEQAWADFFRSSTTSTFLWESQSTSYFFLFFRQSPPKLLDSPPVNHKWHLAQPWWRIIGTLILWWWQHKIIQPLWKTGIYWSWVYESPMTH